MRKDKNPMDSVEKVLNGLIDSMHKHIAKGNGNKKVDVSIELEKAKEIEPEEPATEEKREPSAFDKFLEQAKANRPKPKGTEMNFSSKNAKHGSAQSAQKQTKDIKKKK